MGKEATHELCSKMFSLEFCKCQDSRQRSLEFADIGSVTFRDISSYVFGKDSTSGFGLIIKNRDPCFNIGCVDARDQATLKSRNKTRFEPFQIGWRTIRCEHNLFVVLKQRVEGMKKLALTAFCLQEELDVINKKDIGRSIGRDKLARIPSPDTTDIV